MPGGRGGGRAESFKLFPNQTVGNTQCLASAQIELPFHLWNNEDDNSILRKENRERGKQEEEESCLQARTARPRAMLLLALAGLSLCLNLPFCGCQDTFLRHAARSLLDNPSVGACLGKLCWLAALYPDMAAGGRQTSLEALMPSGKGGLGFSGGREGALGSQTPGRPPGQSGLVKWSSPSPGGLKESLLS